MTKRVLGLLTILLVGGMSASALTATAATEASSPASADSTGATRGTTTSIVGWRTDGDLSTKPAVKVPTAILSGGSRIQRTVLVQRATTPSAPWRTIRTMTSDRQGRLTVRLDVRSRSYFRLVAPAQRGYARTVSGTRWYTYVPRGVKGRIRPVSVTPSGATGNSHSWGPQVSPDGTKIAFTSLASDLTADSAVDRHADVFVRDLRTGSTRLVSSSSGGVPANGASGLPQWLPNGHGVAFASTATNLGGAAGLGDIWVKDLRSGSLAKIASTGVAWDPVMATYSPGPAPNFPRASPLQLSTDGRHLAAQIDPTKDPHFSCTPTPEDPWAIGSCTETALGSIDISDGSLRVIGGGTVFMSASGPALRQVDALAWLPGGVDLLTSHWATCYHCNEGPTVSRLNADTLTEIDITGCGHTSGCDAVRVSAPSASGNFARTHWYYGYPGADPLANLSLVTPTGRSTSVALSGRWQLGDLQFAGFTPSGESLALQAEIVRDYVQALHLPTGTVRTWSAARDGQVLRRGGYDPHWVGESAMAFVTTDPRAIRRDSNRASDVVVKTLR